MNQRANNDKANSKEACVQQCRLLHLAKTSNYIQASPDSCEDNENFNKITFYQIHFVAKG